MIVRIFKKNKIWNIIIFLQKRTHIDQEKYNYNFIHRILIILSTRQ